jgi:hypothetical protein
MDPKANITEQIKLARKLQFVADKAEYDVEYDREDVARLADLVIALHEWQVAGGFSPYK